MINKLMIFLRKILNALVFDRLLFTVSPCVENVLCLYSNAKTVKHRTRANWMYEFG